MRLAGGFVATCALMLALVSLNVPAYLQADYATAIGEYRSVDLEDGSVIHLNTNSAVSVAFSERERRIDLLYGEIFLEVEPDGSRPFLVFSNDGLARAVGTKFSVRDLDENTLVIVSEGAVNVLSPSTVARGAVILTQGQGAQFFAGTRPVAVELPKPAAAHAWVQNRIEFDHTPFDEAIRELDRHFAGKIIVAAEIPEAAVVSARLSLSDISGGLQAIARTEGLTATRIGGFLFLVHRN